MLSQLNRYIILCLLALSLNQLIGREVYAIPSDNGYRLYLLIPFSTIQLNERTQESQYLLNITILNSKGKSLHQQSNSFIVGKSVFFPNAAIVQEIDFDLDIPNGKLIYSLRNPVLGDKIEKQVQITPSSVKAQSENGFVILSNGKLRWSPSQSTQLQQDLSECRILNFVAGDSTLVHYKTLAGDTKIYTSYAKYETNLLPIISDADFSSIIIYRYTANIATKMNLPLYNNITFYAQTFSLQDQLQQIKYIADQNEWKVLSTAKKNELESVIEWFWDRHKNHPTVKNEYREQFYQRVFKADELFSFHKNLPGWKSDRGKIYIKYGPPDEVIEEQFPSGKSPYIKWYYYKESKVFLFVDKSGYGNFKLWDEYYEN